MIANLTPRHRAREFPQFLDLIDQQLPDGLAAHVVLVNMTTHCMAAIRCWLQRNPGLRVHFTPTTCVRMIPFDRWFAKLTSKSLRLGAHRGVAPLTAEHLKVYRTLDISSRMTRGP